MEDFYALAVGIGDGPANHREGVQVPEYQDAPAVLSKPGHERPALTRVHDDHEIATLHLVHVELA